MPHRRIGARCRTGSRRRSGSRGNANARCRIQNAECRMQNAECRMQNAKCKMQNAKCKMQNAKCRKLKADCRSPIAESWLPRAESCEPWEAWAPVMLELSFWRSTLEPRDGRQEATCAAGSEGFECRRRRPSVSRGRVGAARYASVRNPSGRRRRLRARAPVDRKDGSSSAPRERNRLARSDYLGGAASLRSRSAAPGNPGAPGPRPGCDSRGSVRSSGVWPLAFFTSSVAPASASS